MPFQRLALLLVCVASLTVVSSLQAGSKIYVGAKTQSGISIAKMDHSQWNMILQKYVDADGGVNYSGLKANRVDMASLENYLAKLSAVNPRLPTSRNAKLAFWINAYNAVTLYGILREYPTSSIRNHTAKVFGYNIWHDLQLYVGTTPFSLDSIEHKILRKLGEPRIHFAIVCASVGCPRLLNEAYVPARLDEQLEQNARDFFSRSQNFRFDQADQRFYVSAIIDWFGEDFGRDPVERWRSIARWLPDASARAATNKNAVKVSFLDYDWSLNEQRKRR